MSLKKIKIQIPTVDRMLRFSIVSIVLGTMGLYFFFDWEICIGTLCTSVVLLINIQFWIMIVQRLIIVVKQVALDVDHSSITEESIDDDKEQGEQQHIQSKIDSENYDDSSVEDNDVEFHEKNTNYVPNTGGVYVFFLLKISFLIVLLTVCAFVFSPFCIILSNTIIVFSLLSSSFRVI